MSFENERNLMEFTKGIVGKSFKELDKVGILRGNNNDKGRLGKVVETGFYGYDLNSSPKADFEKLGIELKVSGYRVLQNGTWSAKERLSLSMINFRNIIHEEFEFSKLVLKNKKLLIIWYEYIEDIPYEEFVVHDFQLYDMSSDEEIIRNDFEGIKQKVIAGQAHELSEGDSVILGAATKGKKGGTAEQPNSPIRASTRAYSLKNSFFRGVLRNHKDGIAVGSPAPDALSPEQFVWNKLRPYKGRSQREILSSITGNEISGSAPYNISKMISDRIIGKDKELAARYEVFNKSRFVIRNIPINEINFPDEKATFSTLSHSDFSTSWEDSEWKIFFEEVTFIYVGYLSEASGIELSNGDRVLDRVFKVTFTPEEVEEFGRTYEMIKETIDTNDITKLPTATLNKELGLGLSLIVSTKGSTCGGYGRFLDDSRETCFMLNKEFVHNKLNKSAILS